MPHDRGHGYAFPCDAAGHVALDDMSDNCRNNYSYARTVIGRALSIPVVGKVDAQAPTGLCHRQSGD